MDDEDKEALKGDSGGKAELLRLLEKTSQPVVLACNDVMRLWGSDQTGAPPVTVFLGTC